MSDAGFSLFRVVEEYKGPPLSMVLAGAGSYAARIIECPGASGVVDSIYMPYSRERLDYWTWFQHTEKGIPYPDQTHMDKVQAVSQEMVEVMHWSNNGDGVMPLTVTAAVSSKKQRQGGNRAFIAVGPHRMFEVWHLVMAKLDDVDFEDVNKVNTKRFVQDRMVSECALHLATGVSSTLAEELNEGGYLRRL